MMEEEEDLEEILANIPEDEPEEALLQKPWMKSYCSINRQSLHLKNG